ncbi:MAG: response regulator transcription factor [Oscillospiraceae bacterium]|nr:response regulator transcription factor [Oscillospiraceae bacterium]
MTGKTILLVEDNPKVMWINTEVLESQGAAVLSAENLAEARRILAEKFPNAAVIDIMLPDGSGLDLLREIRAVSALPVLLLTAKGESADVVTGLSLGADDYLAKPYDIDVFAARVEALLRRARTVNENIAVGQLRFDLLSNQAVYGGKDLLLTQKEFSLLLMLTQNEKKTLAAEYLFEKVWGQPLNNDTSALRLQISNLKKKLFAVTEDITIETTRGEGYCLTMLTML